MKSITINKLQNDISKVVREVEEGETFEVMRYSKPLAYLISIEEYEKLKSGENCRECVKDLREITKRLTS